MQLNSRFPAWLAMQSAAEVSNVLGAVQLEWTALSERTGKPVYARKSQKIFHKLHDVYPDQVHSLIVLTCAWVRMTVSACRARTAAVVGHMLRWTPKVV
jgi:Glycosyl hydrolase family 47